MALLNRRFDSEDSATAIENLTAKLKKGIQAASTHFFEQEFPHDTREAILCTLDPTKTPLTPVQSGQAIRDHLEAIGRSTSKYAGYIDRRYWGNEATLRMIGKILNRNIYVVVATSGLEKPSYQIFYPSNRTEDGETFLSVKEQNFDSENSRGWIRALQRELNEKSNVNESPIVLLYQSEHYSWLRFSRDRKKQKPNEHNMQDGIGEVSNTIDLTSEVSQHSAASIESVAKMTTNQAQEHGEQAARVQSKGVGHQEVGNMTTYPTSQSNSESQIESEWASPDITMTDAEEPEKEPHLPHPSSGIGRFRADEGTGRLHHRALNTLWNKLEESWPGSTSFPSLPTTIEQWKQTVKGEPEQLIQHLQQFPSPEYILSGMTDAVLDEWTQDSRLSILLHCLEHIATTSSSTERCNWARQWCDAYRSQAQANRELINLYPEELWKTLKQQKYGGSEMLKLCRASQKSKLIRMLLTAYIYRDELLNISVSSFPTSIMEHLDILFAVMAISPNIEMALEGSDSASYWAVLETIFSIATHSDAVTEGTPASQTQQ